MPTLKLTEKATMTPIHSLLVLSGWHGTSVQPVLTVGVTPKRFRIRAVQRTKLAGRDRWLEPGQETLVPKFAVRHGEWSQPA
jgi:hypothetical protein